MAGSVTAPGVAPAKPPLAVTDTTQQEILPQLKVLVGDLNTIFCLQSDYDHL